MSPRSSPDRDKENTTQRLGFFCDEHDPNDDTLQETSTFELDARVRKCALQLGDKPLMAKLSGGDLVAQEAKYHIKWLVSLYNKVRDADAKTAEPDPGRMNHAVALAELVTYMEEARGMRVRVGRPGSSIHHQDGTSWNNHDRTCSLDQTRISKL